MVNVNQSLGKVKADLAKRLDADSIESVCREANHTWRKCLLNPVALIHIFAMQILCGNTACTHLRHLSHLTFTASAYCQARKRLPLKVFEMLVVRLCEFLCNVCDDSALWFGHRVGIVKQ